MLFIEPGGLLRFVACTWCRSFGVAHGYRRDLSAPYPPSQFGDNNQLPFDRDLESVSFPSVRSEGLLRWKQLAFAREALRTRYFAVVTVSLCLSQTTNALGMRLHTSNTIESD